MFWQIFAAISCVKFLFIPAYRSTDFEVHRNWLAITKSLPVSKWYVDETSQWTLDYPPLFAWFEFVLSNIAVHLDPKMVDVNSLEYASGATIFFQRISVIVTDIIFALGVKKCCNAVAQKSGMSKLTWMSSPVIAATILLCNVGLFIVDQIHFQYNGFLFGVMFLSIGCMLQGQVLQSAFWFSVLLNLKHIYLYIAISYFIYLLTHCIDTSKGKFRFNFTLFLKLGLTVVSVFALSFGPFIFMGQLFQVLQRLFPFKRGLCHAYWAPNAWALYNAADKVLTVAGKKLGLLDTAPLASMTGGLVQEFDHVVLPSVTPRITFILTLVAMIPAVVIICKKPRDPWVFLRSVILCATASFLFGWHVHEKAILLVILPLSLLAVLDAEDCRLYLLLSITGHVSLLPLLFTQFENVLKIFMVLLFSLASYAYLATLFRNSGRSVNFSRLELCYLLGLIPVALFECLSHAIAFSHWQFLPLLGMSVYCAMGVVYFAFLFGKKSLRKDIEEVLRYPSKTPVRPGLEPQLVYRKSRPDRYKSTGLVNAQGSEWSHLRGLLTPDLQSSRLLSELAPDMWNMSDELCHFLRRNKSPDGLVISFEKYIYRHGLEVIIYVLLGKRMGCLDDHMPPLAERLVSATDILFQSGNSAIYLLYNMSKNPTVLEKVYEELDKVAPAGTPITASVVRHLPYLRACVTESFRLNPIAPNVARLTEQDMLFQNYHVPKNSLVICETWVACLQEENFEKAREFIPERWLDKNASEKLSFLLVPFGAGKRMCPGRRLAVQEITILAATILQNFKITFCNPVESIYKFLICPQRPINVFLDERH
nr:EOG090X06YP [Eulimnadia texana]